MMIILIYRTNFIIGVITIITVKIRSPKSPDVVEVGDSSTDLFVVPRGCLWLVLDHVVLHVAEKDYDENDDYVENDDDDDDDDD